MCKISDAFKAKMLVPDTLPVDNLVDISTEEKMRDIDETDFRRIIDEVWRETQPEGITSETYNTVQQHISNFSRVLGNVAQYHSLRKDRKSMFDFVGNYGTRSLVLWQDDVRFNVDLHRCDENNVAYVDCTTSASLRSDNEYKTRVRCEPGSFWDF